jgi:RimJ/RimL family protein N-acetyltransferase
MRIVAVVGLSESGKTHLLAGLISECKRRGLRTFAVKHCSHGFSLDLEGKDTWIYSQAGADGVAMISSEDWAVVRTLAEDELIGFIAFEEINWTDRDAYVSIGIGEPAFWGKGYGSDAMCLMLRYGFTELNLHRISLTVFEQNPRGIRSYEKCGFKHEGRIREFLLRDGRRSDMLHMGILRKEWDQLEQK